MICITGDIHHMSLQTNGQKFISACAGSEAKIACGYTKLIEKNGLKVTHYVTGKTFIEEWDDLRPVTESSAVEIGGHTFEGLSQGTIAKMFYKLRGITPPSHSYSHGSRRKQKRDIMRMLKVVKKKTNRDVVSWRSHGLVFDNNTYSLLAELGVRFISDEVSATKLTPEKTPEGLLSHPLNVIMDHDHLYHAHRNEDFVQRAKERGYGEDAFGCESYSIEAWGEIVEEQVAKIQEKGGVATILMHPICQYLADEFRTAEKLFRFFSKYETCFASDLTVPVKLTQEHPVREIDT